MSSVRGIRKLNVWLRQSCHRLSSQQQKGIVYALSGVYLLLSVYMIAQLFIPKSKEQERVPIVRGEEVLLDSPTKVSLPDSLSTVTTKDLIAMELDSNSNGNR
ncbi:hypothetical protein [Porphyromonas levii]|uniref:hypothetical protein n=1 Tax=Porphyromonas levii TaxID=28114 RepID=UPI001B8B4311|nr:hypothetical protein [Porphyromonas levii]MBR8758712.1 hypothetical protein [Porphyromonas levii]